ncbi:Cna B-type domain-containing protein, partial [Enterococcus faecium]|uniref:Cna B-type domain-containing protein n=1 Tax=Enterococcus faecium TaxID=1352 RepID=UPI0002A28BE6
GQEIIYTVTEDNVPEYSTNLPKYRDGQEIIYTVTEDNVPEYSTTIDGYNIKNSYTPEKTNISIPGSHITPWKNFPEKTEREN